MDSCSIKNAIGVESIISFSSSKIQFLQINKTRLLLAIFTLKKININLISGAWMGYNAQSIYLDYSSY